MASQRNWGLLFILDIKNSGFSLLLFFRVAEGGSAPKLNILLKCGRYSHFGMAALALKRLVKLCRFGFWIASTDTSLVGIHFVMNLWRWSNGRSATRRTGASAWRRRTAWFFTTRPTSQTWSKIICVNYDGVHWATKNCSATHCLSIIVYQIIIRKLITSL